MKTYFFILTFVFLVFIGYEKKVDGDLAAKLIALTCSEAPEDFSRWSLRLLADKMVELEYIDSISHVGQFF